MATLSGFAPVLAVEWRSTLNQHRIQMMRTLFGIDNNHVIAPRRNENEVGMRHGITFAACHADFVWCKRYRAIEFANGFNDHGKRIIARRLIIKLSKPPLCVIPGLEDDPFRKREYRLRAQRYSSAMQ